MEPKLRLNTSVDSSSTSGYLFVTGSTAAAGLATVLGKLNLEAVSPLTMNCLIFSVAALILGLWLLPRRGFKAVFRLSARGWLWMSLFALSSWCAIFLFWAGVQKMDPSLAAFLNRSEVPVAILLAVLLLRERLNRWEVVGAALSIGGIFIMRATMRIEYTEGFWLVLSGSFLFGLTELFSKIAIRHVEPTLLTFLRNLSMAVLYWLVFLSGTGDLQGVDLVWPGIIALGIVGPILSRVNYMQALKRMELTKVAVISQGQPVFVILIALVFFRHLPSLREMLGGIILTFGCLIMVYARTRKETPTVLIVSEREL
ncbi:MAG: EamA family transporter [bacterium]